jgi:hypothetical protein
LQSTSFFHRFHIRYSARALYEADLGEASAIGSVFMKLPALVQTAATDYLSQIRQSADDSIKRTQFNLTICYVNGFDADDLGKASRLILGTARLQMLYINIFQHIHGADRVDASEELEWLRAAASRGNRLALERVKRFFNAEHAEMKRLYQSALSPGTCPNCFWGESSENLNRLCERLDRINWRKAFVRLAIIYE